MSEISTVAMKKSWWIPILIALATAFFTGKFTTTPNTVIKTETKTDTLKTVITDTLPMFVVSSKTITDTVTKGDTIYITKIEEKEVVKPRTLTAEEQPYSWLKVRTMVRTPDNSIANTYTLLRPIYTHLPSWYLSLEIPVIDHISIAIDHQFNQGGLYWGVGIGTDKKLRFRIGKAF